MISLSQVSKVFNQGSPNEVAAVRNIDLNILNGEFVVIIGSNGSGKSTLLNLLAGNIQPDTGSIFMAGEDVTRMPDFKRSKWVARVFQDPLKGTAADLSILDNFRLAALRTSTKSLWIANNTVFKNTVRDKLRTLDMGLEDKTDRLMGSLSGGQRQALTLLMSVLDQAHILLLDEPSAALDPRSAERVMHLADKLIQEYQLTAVLVTHQLKDAFRYGNRLLFMDDGQVIRDIHAQEKEQLAETDLYSWFMHN